MLEYRGRYTHKVAISKYRFLTLEAGNLAFRWRESRHHTHPRVMTREATEFIRRFRRHLLPAGFVRSRHVGLLSHRQRTAKLALCRQ